MPPAVSDIRLNAERSTEVITGRKEDVCWLCWSGRAVGASGQISYQRGRKWCGNTNTPALCTCYRCLTDKLCVVLDQNQDQSEVLHAFCTLCIRNVPVQRSCISHITSGEDSGRGADVGFYLIKLQDTRRFINRRHRAGWTQSHSIRCEKNNVMDESESSRWNFLCGNGSVFYHRHLLDSTLLLLLSLLLLIPYRRWNSL